MNGLKTTFLLTLLTVLLVLAGEYFGGERGMIFAFVIAAATNFFSYFYSDKIALAMYGAQPVTREQLPRAYNVVERLTQRAGLPMPKIYVIPTESPNAFATGRNPQHASVAVTHGILGLLNEEELEGVLAHELGHVRNRDILTSSIAATLAGAITILARMGFWFGAFGGGGGGRRRGGGIGAILMLILAPFAAMLIQLWVSRTREYEADASGAHLTGNPYALASALEKISAVSRRCHCRPRPARRICLSWPRCSPGEMWANLFSTHPPVQKRIERLIGRPSVYGNCNSESWTVSSATVASTDVLIERTTIKLFAVHCYTVPLMKTFLRTLLYLALIVWLGAEIYFPAVAAVTFTTLMPDIHAAGTIVGALLRILHGMGLVSGMVALAVLALAPALARLQSARGAGAHGAAAGHDRLHGLLAVQHHSRHGARPDRRRRVYQPGRHGQPQRR